MFSSLSEIPMGTTPLDLVSVEDIGEVARTVFLNQSRFLNKTLSLCGSKITINEMAHYLTQYLRPMQFKDKPVRKWDYMSRDVSRPVFGVSDQVRHKSACTAGHRSRLEA